ncbi:hypothetical protein TNIN_29441 [Trichonephila inaurata madagascariensis]|uniref:Uncharacterized protein n=1 Tax=Trichonephila inaurata madagascariensis TaxID=2747483 RepID=A0A8X6YFS1_9ARAC|nr:hypothetical protein TNIN_29441 [Trichonephila inaurata madagascariensis]
MAKKGHNKDGEKGHNKDGEKGDNEGNSDEDGSIYYDEDVCLNYGNYNSTLWNCPYCNQVMAACRLGKHMVSKCAQKRIEVSRRYAQQKGQTDENKTVKDNDENVPHKKLREEERINAKRKSESDSSESGSEEVISNSHSKTEFKSV